MKILMTSIFVDDPIKAHEYYTKALGFQSKDFQPESHLAVVVSPEDSNGTTILLVSVCKVQLDLSMSIIRPEIPSNFKGDITISYTNYKVNRGIDDSIFEEEKEEISEEKESLK